MSNRQRLDALFAGHESRLYMLAETDTYGSVLEAAEHLLEDADGLRVQGVEKLRAAGSTAKFEALLSELRVGNLLARLGFDVQVLGDEEFGPGAYTPDLRVRRGHLEILVEVFHGSDGGPDLAGPLDRALEASGLRFRVTQYLGESLSVPGITYEERTEAETMVERVVEQVIAHLRALNPMAKGSVTIESHRFDYEPSPGDRGYASGSVTAIHWLREDEHAAKLLSEIERKAMKQPRLPADRQATPFVVAYDNREAELSTTTVLSALTGSRCAFSESCPGEREHWKRTNPVHHPPHVMSALAGPWGGLLEGWGFGLDSDCRITEYGALVGAP